MARVPRPLRIGLWSLVGLVLLVAVLVDALNRRAEP